MDVDAIRVGEPEAPPKGTSDEELLIFCEHESRLFITADRATVPDCFANHLQQGRHTWGVLVLGPSASLSQILDELSLIHTESEAEEWIDILHFLPMFH
jgi:hypothetical protein